MQRVRISGLQGKPEFNGCFGKCVSWNDSKGRYGVALEGREEALSLKASNLTAASATDGTVLCGHCGSDAAAMRCTRCFSVFYCDNDCQKKGWDAHQPLCKPPPIAELNRPNREMSHEQHAALQTHMEAAIRAGRSGSQAAKMQEIKMLKQSAAADESQPMTWFNLAQCYKKMGSRVEAVKAMDRAVFYLVQGLEPGAVDLSDADLREEIERATVEVAIEGARLLEDSVVGRHAEELGVDEALGARLQILADGCGERLHPGARSLVHHVYGNVLRKRGKNKPALAQLRAADKAAWNSGAGERDLLSLSMIPDVLSAYASEMEPRGAGLPASAAAQKVMAEAVEAAREALHQIPLGHPMYASAQLGLARALSNSIVFKVGAQGNASGQEMASLRQEGVRWATAVRNSGGGGDPSLVAVAEKLLAPGQPLGMCELRKR